MGSSKVFAATLLAASVAPMAAQAAEDGLDALDGLEMDVLDVGVAPEEAATAVLVLPEPAAVASDGGAELGENTTEAVGEAVAAGDAETVPPRERRRPAAERPDREERGERPEDKRPEKARRENRQSDDHRKDNGPRPARTD